jgi:predicted RNA binding protein YcfA (HicA-like mRNA interferase family)
MPKLPNLNSKQIIKIFEAKGFVLNRTSGSHYLFYNKEKDKRVTVPYHNKDLPKGTLLSILRMAGISKEEISQLK